MGKYKELKPEGLKRYSIADRGSKVDQGIFAQPSRSGEFADSFLNSLPSILKARDFALLIEHLKQARAESRPIIWLMGAHVIKCGLNPLIIDLLRDGWVSLIGLNGAGVIHDTELALYGSTSEEVGETLKDGSFGMVIETNDFINEAVTAGYRDLSLPGYGEAMGQALKKARPRYENNCLLTAAFDRDVPVTVHVGIGTDINHPHPTADGAAIGTLSLRDFRILAHVLTGLKGGVVLHWGSTVILPEVFLKALSYVRNLGYPAFDFTTANFDMIQHYRPNVNVVNRPTQDNGQGYSFTGHHEIMLPLLASVLKNIS
ncbi:hypothetical protein JW877_06815 [bacterium]|nr:hypothetical protein [bacterium]